MCIRQHVNCVRRQIAAGVGLPVVIFAASQHAKWDVDSAAVLVNYSVGRDRGRIRISAATFAGLFGRSMKPADCVEAYHLHRVAFERAAEGLYRSGIVEPNGEIVIQPRDLP